MSRILPSAQAQSLFKQAATSYRLRTEEVLLAALVDALARWNGGSRQLVDLEGHGRGDGAGGFDLSRTVGWFTELFPVVLEIPSGGDEGDLLKAVKERVRIASEVSQSYGLLRYLGEEEVRRKLSQEPEAEILFNFLGQVGGGAPNSARFSVEPLGPIANQSPRARRKHALEVNASLGAEGLEMTFAFSAALHQRPTIEALADAVVARLAAFEDHLRLETSTGYTPSDFPLARLGQEALDALVAGRRGVEDLYPLSPLQEGMLFHILSAKETGVYFGQLSYELEGQLEEAAFRAAWEAVVERHPALRTVFLWEGLDRPLQMVLRDLNPEWVQEDWSRLEEGERTRFLNAYLSRDRARGFPMGQGPLLRLALFRTGRDRCRFVWSYHQAVIDGWSLPIVFEEVVSYYLGFVRGERLGRAPARPFRDYISWLDRQKLDEAETFWRREMAGIQEPTPLAVDHPAAQAVDEKRSFVNLRRELPEEVFSSLQRLARDWKVTANTLVQGAW
ncbi:MAG: non-ribosomal peptide synthetase, partial [Acidobacteria bacterium]|nr:non-ribosomal peptide synthetase [Acidobacteriota bacterium]